MKTERIIKNILVASVLLGSFAAYAGSLDVKMLPGEKWWGVCNSVGSYMPFSEKSDFSCEPRLDH